MWSQIVMNFFCSVADEHESPEGSPRKAVPHFTGTAFRLRAVIEVHRGEAAKKVSGRAAHVHVVIPRLQPSAAAKIPGKEAGAEAKGRLKYLAPFSTRLLRRFPLHGSHASGHPAPATPIYDVLHLLCYPQNLRESA